MPRSTLPKLIIVDELAHSNAPESRHPKRYQDIEELIAAGIDVRTAVNIQHLESLSDVVSTITGVSVRETVPDTVVEKADEVVVVDITPAELIQRLNDSKVYLPENAKRAADNFFKPGNLTALRELALRRTADRVDDQMVVYLRQNAIEGPWPAAERILVCVGTDPLSERWCEPAAGSRAASTPPGSPCISPASIMGRRAIGCSTLDERCGSRSGSAPRLARLTGRRSDRRDLALCPPRERHADRDRAFGGGLVPALRRRSLPEEIVRRASGIAVISHSEQPAARRWSSRGRVFPRSPAPPFLSVSAAVGIGIIASHFLVLPNLSMIFLAAVLFCAVTFGAWSAILAAFLSFFAYNFFFIAPIYTFTIAEPHELLALLIFLSWRCSPEGSPGGYASNPTRRRAACRHAIALRFLAQALGPRQARRRVLGRRSHVAKAVGGGAFVLLGKGEDLDLGAAFPPEDTLGPGEWAAARWSATRGEIAGWRTATLPNGQFRFSPLRTSRGILGVIGVRPASDNDVSAEDERALSALIDQAAVAIERTQLVDEAAKAQAAVESERLRGALLSSLSHDLRTPLSSIMGAVTGLRHSATRCRLPRATISWRRSRRRPGGCRASSRTSST